MLDAPAWRREPYRLFFPLGILLAWAGLFHWILFALGWSDYRVVFHSIAQIQGFMTCFGVGFLFTAIPRRTGTAPPAAWQMIVGLSAPVLTTVAAWFGRFAESQLPWFVLVVTLIAFAVARFRARGPAARRPPASFVWVPVALLMGLAGVVLLALFGICGLAVEVHELGQLLILQGVFLGLVLGVGGMVLPLITCGEAPPDAPTGVGVARALHLAAALGIVATFVLQTAGHARIGFAARGAIALAVLLLQSKIYRWPRKPGAHRWLVWLSAWAIPLGLFVAAWTDAPGYHPGLHITFVGGFGLMALAVGLHVTLAHSGRAGLAERSPWQVAALGLFVVAAVVLRLLVSFDGARMLTWIGWSAGVFLAGTLFWLWLAAQVFWAPAKIRA